MTLKVHFDGKVFVPDEPVDLPAGAAGEVIVEERGTAKPTNSGSLISPVIVGLDPEVGRAIGQDPEFDIENS